jgi:hypothetical protein
MAFPGGGTMVSEVPSTKIVEVSSDNLAEHPQVICYINRKHPLYHRKIEWLKEEFQRGLRIKLLYLEGQKRPFGFVEYVSGENCWRSVNARGYLFIHCLWTNGKKYQHQGLGSLLLKEVERDAKGMLGVCAVTSDGPFMATGEIFLKNGYSATAESEKDQLMTKQLKKGPLPSINDWRDELGKYRGLNIVYSRQCPWVARFVEEVKPLLEEKSLKPRIVELGTPAEAQKAPSLYGVFNLIQDSRLLADRYISTTRFKNIVEKELEPS